MRSMQTSKANLLLLTVTPNPALDLSGVVDRIAPNEKNYVHDEKRDPGGNGINSARLVCRLRSRHRTLATGFLGGSAGEEIRALLNEERVPNDFCPIAAQTRINITVSNRQTHQQTRLAFAGPQVSQTDLARLAAKIRHIANPGILILGGSLPKGLRPSAYAQLAAAAQKRNMGVFLDIPARLIDQTVRALPSRPLFLKPNLAELSEWYGANLEPGDPRVMKAASELAKKVCLVCVSLGDQGALLVTREPGAASPSMILQGKTPRIRAKGTVGAGDSMVGAIASSLLEAGLYLPSHLSSLSGEGTKKKPELELILGHALRIGMAAGAATAETKGTHLAKNRAEILRLFKKTRVFRVG